MLPTRGKLLYDGQTNMTAPQHNKKDAQDNRCGLRCNRPPSPVEGHVRLEGKAMPPRRSSNGTAADDPTADAQPSIVDRITVALVRKAGEDLQNLQDRTSLSKTDLVNRAITLYEFIDSQVRQGRDLLIRDRASGETQTILLL